MSIILALLIDRWWGEPPARFHPVVWMGSYLKRAGRGLPDRGPRKAFFLGTLYWLAGAALVAAVYGVAGAEFAKLPPWLDIVLTAVLLKPLFALRLLLSEVGAVESSLMQGVECGRARLAHIVSRDTATLDLGEVRESSLESLAENLSDSIIAPLFWFALFGLPGAAVYRFANTADAMWGYRGRWEWAGKFAARADDVLNFIPARMTAVALLLVGPKGMSLIRRLPAEAARTASPNSGWPMGALALSLNVRLRKPQVYALNANGSAPSAADTSTALRRAEATAWIVAALFAVGIQLLPGVGATEKALLAAFQSVL
ncbi:MAG TPA: adenosylcobinamide-phosphate synthase CbiB [Steroidobacteraceae bacterium]|nr:adenosylcobinamide-phosphate synthase CbiB [Steroidobacteraceae bacterium]